MTDKPRASFILLEYHDPEEVAGAVAAISQYCADLPHEIIVASNSCYGAEGQAACREQVPGAQWVFNPHNGGFASGMNAGIRKARAPYLVLSNADARLASAGLGAMLDRLDATPEIGLIGPRLCDDAGVTQESCRPFMSIGRFLRRQLHRLIHRGATRSEMENDDGVRAVDWVVGGFMIVRAGAVAKAGLLDEGYFLYVEDMDWCWRFWDAGYEVQYDPTLTVRFTCDRRSTRLLGKGWALNRFALIHARSYARFLRKRGLFARRPGSKRDVQANHTA